MTRLIKRVRAILGASLDPSFSGGIGRMPTRPNSKLSDTSMLARPALQFVAPALEPGDNAKVAPGNRWNQSITTWRGFGGDGPQPLPEGNWRKDKKKYRRLDEYSERYYNVTPNQALGAGGRAVMMKLPR